VRSNPVDAVRRLYENEKQSLYTYAMSLARDTDVAEDAIQTAFCGLLRGQRLPREIRPYLFRSVRNAIIDDHRRRDRQADTPLETAREGEVRGHPIRDRVVCQCLERLAERDSEIVVLKVFAGLTFREIARVCESPTNTVASRYRRALETMRTMLEVDS
jgi:RNA polymerase sigma-70 factor (ECF subfamily)